VAAIGAGGVGVRLLPGNPLNDVADADAPATCAHVMRELAKRKLAYLDVMNVQPGFDVPALVRANYSGQVILNAGYDRARAEADVAAGVAAIAFGGPFIANPDLPARLAGGLALAAPDKATFYEGDACGYKDYRAAA